MAAAASLIACVLLVGISYALFAYALAWGISTIDAVNQWKAAQLYFDIVNIISFVQWPVLLIGTVSAILLFFIRAKKLVFIILLSVFGLCFMAVIAHWISAILLLYMPRAAIGLHGILLAFMATVTIAVFIFLTIMLIRYIKAGRPAERACN